MELVTVTRAKLLCFAMLAVSAVASTALVAIGMQNRVVVGLWVGMLAAIAVRFGPTLVRALGDFDPTPEPS